MNALDKLVKAQSKNNSMVCVGLDLDPKRMPAERAKSFKTMFDFLQQIIDATADQVCAYKPNIAFYEALGPEGLSLLRQIIERIPDHIPVIIDAKRGDIGNTASQYAGALLEHYGADWVTLNPYMGYDSLRPFIEHKDKGAFILCLTSNTGSKDFQLLPVEGKPLYAVVAEKVAYWNKFKNCGLVVGATAPEQLAEIRGLAEDMPILIPGIGAQGGSLEKAVVNGTANFAKPALINVSRSVLYASTGQDFAAKAREEVLRLNQAINQIRAGEHPSQKQPEPPNPPNPPRESDSQGREQDPAPQQATPDQQNRPPEQEGPPQDQRPSGPDQPRPDGPPGQS